MGVCRCVGQDRTTVLSIMSSKRLDSIKRLCYTRRQYIDKRGSHSRPGIYERISHARLARMALRIPEPGRRRGENILEKLEGLLAW